jgi:hypothetical protein
MSGVAVVVLVVSLFLPPGVVGSQGAPPVLPLTGSFVDPYYDNRLHYSNGPGLQFSCYDWSWKMEEWRQLGLEYVVFQDVHDVIEHHAARRLEKGAPAPENRGSVASRVARDM